MKEAFEAKNFSIGSRLLIQQANAIIEEYQSKGFVLTLRQLYYQFVSRDLIPNTIQSYKRLGSVINDARLAGKIDWDAIEDRTRNLAKLPQWHDPKDILESIAEQYREDVWSGQPRYVEVWIEKEALVGVVEGVCDENRVPYFACRGYTSQSEAYGAGKRFARMRRAGRTPLVLHLGDHDPSGIDMTRDNAARLGMFARMGVEVRRLALNRDQIDRYEPPPNPAKETDSRFAGYLAEHGDESFELDALDPEVIAALVQEAVDDVRDIDAWTDALAAEADNRAKLRAVSDEWAVVERVVADEGSIAAVRETLDDRDTLDEEDE